MNWIVLHRRDTLHNGAFFANLAALILTIDGEPFTMGRHVILVVVILILASMACTLGTPSESNIVTEDIEARPLVLLLAPVNGSVIAEGAQVALHAVALDSQVGVARIEFRIDDVPVGEAVSDQAGGQPVLDAVGLWQAAGQTGHLVTVEAFRADGSSLGISDVSVNVVPQPRARANPPTEAAAETIDAAPTPVQEQPPAPPTETTIEQPPTEIPAPVPTEPTAFPGVAASVVYQILNVRQGPGTNYPAVNTLSQGDQVTVIGRNTDSTWLAISFGGGTAWVIAESVSFEGDISQLPLVAAP